ncbi:phospho-sugar mutase [Staphylococcus arlettae]|uniref:phospho-sugar mutase n=1 Tax=Staphylococcus arlettae TaxID=29378 RepID=UPI000DCCC435|nr:phospho-sugar mutase [Staphylococcus arlettae]RBA01352.1 Phosphoglucomutase [Staphylococcus arlettae]RBA01867.1 Phosphoglucomutase [Staphylococcus arlettae]RBA06349.1 Phosphoglucomutase [Staphylococcus arlettae]
MKQQWIEKLDESLVKPFYETQSEEEVEYGFNSTLSFGTAGIRSTFGIGPGKLNAFTVRKVALGLAQFLTAQHATPSVVIHFDTRYLSKEFSEEMAGILAANGVQVILAASYKSTPELSFAVRHLNATAGVMITASHNPKNYNGIKVYNVAGGQLLPEESTTLSSYIDAIDKPLEINKPDFTELKANKKIQYLDDAVTNSYIEAVTNLIGKIEHNNEKVVLTSLHGTSLPILEDILTELEYSNYVIEKEQSQPDGGFPTVKSANPEEVDAFEMGISLAQESKATLVIATDPDADRLGFVELYEDGSYRYFNGNEIGLMLMKLRFQDLADSNEPLYIVKSIVTSELAERLGQLLDVEINNVLTGFKYISELLEQKDTEKEKLLLAFEESHGYLAESISRDKDAIQIVPLIIKYKNLLAQNGLTFNHVINDIYQNVGQFEDKTVALSYEGVAGVNKINAIMDQFRTDTALPTEMCGLTVKRIEDYQQGIVTKIEEQTVQSLTLPKTNLIRFIFDEGFIALRPSGTEPKIKLYFSLNVENITAIVDQFKAKYVD